MLPSDFSLGSLSFSPVHPLEDKGEYLLEYIPKMTNTTSTSGPTYLMIISPYIVMAQKPETMRKLSHGSPLVHVTRPTIRFRGRRNGCEKARARVMVGGVAMSKGDFRCTKMVDRCLVAGEEVPDAGEKAAVVRRFTSSLDFPDPVSGPRAGDEVISAIQGVSDLCQSRSSCKSGKFRRVLHQTYQTQPCKSMQLGEVGLPRTVIILQDSLSLSLKVYKPRKTVS